MDPPTVVLDVADLESSPLKSKRYQLDPRHQSIPFGDSASEMSSRTSNSGTQHENVNGYRSGGRGGTGGRNGGGHGGSRSSSAGSFTKSNGANEQTRSGPPIIQPLNSPDANRNINTTRYPTRPLTGSPVLPQNQRLVLDSGVFPAQRFSPPPKFGKPLHGPKQSPPRSSTSVHGSSPGMPSERMPPRGPISFNGSQHWTSLQEGKVKVSGIPRDCWTGDLYKAFENYGTIAKIEMESEGSGRAWVVFQPPPHPAIYEHHLRVAAKQLKVDKVELRPFTVRSPVDPGRVYHEINIFFANTLNFGVSVADSAMMVMRTVEAPGEVRMTLNLNRKELDFQFPLVIDEEIRKLRFRLPMALLQNVYKVTDNETGQCALIFPFESPPQFFMQVRARSVYTTCRRKEKTWTDWVSWYRQTDVVDKETRMQLGSEPVMNHRDRVLIDIGRWSTYRISFDEAALAGQKYEELRNALSDHGIVIHNRQHYTLQERVTSPVWSMLQEEVAATYPCLMPTSKESAFTDLAAGQFNLDFSIRYQLEVCLSNGLLKEHSITREFLQRLAAIESAHAVCILEKVAANEHVYYNPMDIFNIQLKQDWSRNIPSYCVLSRAVNITPTVLHVVSPVVETSNRIIRKHAAETDRFIRVKFTDEKTEGKIHSQDDNRSEAVFDRIRRAMNNGIVVAGRHYKFLAFGNSQFREHGAYFYAPTTSRSADDIRNSMGQFDRIRTPAKFGARLGQCFSTTRAIQSINVRIVKIKDITKNGYTFTDGVGKISMLLAKMVAQELGLHNPFVDPPSLYQFRLAGCKGVLAIDPELVGNVVHIRHSQYKFEAQNVGLEIIRASALTVACFNRQLIIILSNLGVPDNTFIQKQQEMMHSLERATTEESVALKKLQRNIDFNQTTLTMAGMILDGFMKSREPFMMSLLHLWRAYNIKFLKEKARIIIEDGAFVLGCVDETATLIGHYNNTQSRTDATQGEKLATLPEIFLQISDPERKGHYKVIEGICVLARNPSLHPGDVRVVRAVDVRALHHLKNVVVLPQTGDRDIPNMCSGGDLDGDDYIVLWDNSFIPTTINEPPMDFTPEKPVESDRPITVADITKFFVTYMKNDSLGRIATSHLAQADFNVGGVRDEKCLELAKLHSQAVDYPKSGIPAVMGRELKARKWPHFQESKFRPEHQIYKSRKILGKLYDQVELVDFKPQYGNAFDSRILNAYQLSEAILVEAADIKSSYDSALKRLMAKHAIRTEFEAWSVFVLSHNMESRDYTFAEEFGRSIEVLRAQFRNVIKEAAEAWQLPHFVAAMYTVTAHEMQAALEECEAKIVDGGQEVPVRKMDPKHMPLMSFPWLFVKELGEIATRHNMERSTEIHQGAVHKRVEKAVDNTHAFSHEPGLGEIETAKGVTHYGELLKLEFDEAGNARSSSQSQEVSEKAPNEGPNSESIEPGGNSRTECEEPESPYLEVGVDIDFKGKKPSALDRLKGL